jgi:spore germination cell wall hydrolase CwlJ-like protein
MTKGLVNRALKKGVETKVLYTRQGHSNTYFVRSKPAKKPKAEKKAAEGEKKPKVKKVAKKSTKKSGEKKAKKSTKKSSEKKAKKTTTKKAPKKEKAAKAE